MPVYLSAPEAATRLGVSRQTLYAYVSRGLLQAHAGETPRESRYLQDDVERLAGQRTRGRKPKEVVKAALDWGLPVLESTITLIEDGQLYYRGENAISLAAGCTVEDLAGLLWGCPERSAFGPDAPALPAAMAALQPCLAGRRLEETLLLLFAAGTEDGSTAAWQASPERLAEGCGALVRLLAACLLNTAPHAAPVHQQCASAWRLNHQGADLIRQALVLCADHELNASSFTARCVASTGASLRAAVVGGLAALTGGKHGGTTARVEALWDELDRSASPEQRLRQRLARGEDLPGFGHHLYPQGDVRAESLLRQLLPHNDHLKNWIAEAQALTGQRPSIDFALVALRRHLALPEGAAFGLFALGRSIGWLAHAMEQRHSGQLIRPRAAYTGPRPAQPTENRRSSAL
ncbi:citrate synthase family protein [Paracidovorax valerianellae]|uniref:citrate synthase (unknown stereospecificity) n=1 Tax=Paracidovorax valerianellae TaxID=187868 RepID=A0A1G6IWR9_9BURK|nr:citrate synthase family protein [Paracidovorax valerianellae]MDA8443693.1 citrate synthase family protein [Paracidovorax valerianellae]SDC10206.1 citrate synthase [Paracidovorax valerianellae]